MPDPEGPVPPQEAVGAPESPKQLQFREVRSVASSLLHRRIMGVKSEIAGKGQEELDAVRADQGKKALHNILYISERLNGAYEIYRPEGDINKISDEELIAVETDQGKGRIASINGADTNNFHCSVRYGTGDETKYLDETIARQDVVNALLVSEADAVLTQFSGDEQQAVRMYIDSLKEGENASSFANGQAVAETVRRAAEASGVVTVSDLRDFVEAEFEKRKDKNAPVVGEEGQAEGAEPAQPVLTAEQVQLRQEVLQLLEGKNLADFATMRAVLDKLGGGWGGNTTAEGGALAKYFEQMELGNVDTDRAKILRDLVKAGKMDEFLQEINKEFAAKEEAPKTVEDRVIAGQIEVVTAKIDQLTEEAKTSETKEQQLAKVQGLLSLLKLAARTSGPEGEAFKGLALRVLFKTEGFGLSNVENLNEAIQFNAKQLVVEGVGRRLSNYFLNSGINLAPEQWNRLNHDPIGVVEDLLRSGKIPFDENFKQVFFGENATELEDSELQGLLEGAGLTPDQVKLLRKKVRGGLLALLIVSLMGGKFVFDQFAPQGR